LTVDDPGRSLPSVAEARLAEIRRSGTWGSALTADEFTAIKSTGFEPVGQVLGAAVYNIGYTGGYACPAYGGGYGLGRIGVLAPTPYNTVTATSGSGSLGSYAPLVRAMYDARRQAIGRMTRECQELGGHGVVGVKLTIGSFPAGGLEFKAIGTAVRAPGAPPVSSWPALRERRRRPFSSDLSGPDFAKLIMTGWVPAGLALGISIGCRHDDPLTVSQTLRGSGNAEVTGYTELVSETSSDARRELRESVRWLGGQGVVIAAMDMQVRERLCAAAKGDRQDHIVEVTIVGTAIVRFTRPEKPRRDQAPQRQALQRQALQRQAPQRQALQRQALQRRGPLAVMSLDPQRRQAAAAQLPRRAIRLGP